MFFEINVSNGVPVYEQVARQIKFAIAEGAFEPGQLIPSVREMARELAINPNTVARAYRDLQSEQIIEAVRGSGLAVARGARAACRDSRQRLIRERISLVLEEALRSQLAPEEISKIVDVELRRLPSKIHSKN
jgi:GntR family transcriptional regulator